MGKYFGDDIFTINALCSLITRGWRLLTLVVVEDGEGDLVCPGGALLQPHAVPGPPEQLARGDQVAVPAHAQLGRDTEGERRDIPL